MRTIDLYPTNSNRPNYFIKMTKTRTVTVLLMIISTCAIILSLTDAYPTTELTNAENLSETNPDRRNNTQIIITHIIRTIEFEIGVVEDDGVDSDNGTSLTTSEFTETDLNVDLLKEIIDNMDEENSSPKNTGPEEEEANEKDGLVPTQSVEERIFEN